MPAKKPPTIIHEYGENNDHRLIIEGSVGFWYPYTEVAQQDGYYAVTSHHDNLSLPEVFKPDPQESFYIGPSMRFSRVVAPLLSVSE